MESFQTGYRNTAICVVWIVSVLCTVSLTSCKDDEPISVSSEPTQLAISIHKISPSVVYQGDTIAISGAFRAVTSANQVFFSAGVEGRVLAASTTSIIAIVPKTAKTGRVGVKMGTLLATSTDSLTVLSKNPIITDLQPRTGYADDTITITGKFFSSQPKSNAVVFAGTVAAVVVGASPTSLRVIVPNALNGKITVTVDERTSNSPFDFQYLVRTIAISKVEPVQASAGEVVHIFCTWLPSKLDGIRVRVGSYSASIISIEKKSYDVWDIAFRVPAGAISNQVWVETSEYQAESQQVLTIIKRILPFKNCAVGFAGLRLHIQQNYVYTHKGSVIEKKDTTYWINFTPTINTAEYTGTKSKGFLDNIYSFGYQRDSRESQGVMIILDSVDISLDSLILTYKYHSAHSSGKQNSSQTTEYIIRLGKTDIIHNSSYEYTMSGDKLKELIKLLNYTDAISDMDWFWETNKQTSRKLIGYECTPAAKFTVKFFD